MSRHATSSNHQHHNKHHSSADEDRWRSNGPSVHSSGGSNTAHPPPSRVDGLSNGRRSFDSTAAEHRRKQLMHDVFPPDVQSGGGGSSTTLSSGGPTTAAAGGGLSSSPPVNAERRGPPQDKWRPAHVSAAAVESGPKPPGWCRSFSLGRGRGGGRTVSSVDNSGLTGAPLGSKLVVNSMNGQTPAALQYTASTLLTTFDGLLEAAHARGSRRLPLPSNCELDEDIRAIDVQGVGAQYDDGWRAPTSATDALMADIFPPPPPPPTTAMPEDNFNAIVHNDVSKTELQRNSSAGNDTNDARHASLFGGSRHANVSEITSNNEKKIDNGFADTVNNSIGSDDIFAQKDVAHPPIEQSAFSSMSADMQAAPPPGGAFDLPRSAASSLAEAGTESATIMRPGQMMWFYRDPQGDWQGQFPTSDILSWFEKGYFPLDLPLRAAGVPEGGPMFTLSDMLPAMRMELMAISSRASLHSGRPQQDMSSDHRGGDALHSPITTHFGQQQQQEQEQQQQQQLMQGARTIHHSPIDERLASEDQRRQQILEQEMRQQLEMQKQQQQQQQHIAELQRQRELHQAREQEMQRLLQVHRQQEEEMRRRQQEEEEMRRRQQQQEEEELRRQQEELHQQQRQLYAQQRLAYEQKQPDVLSSQQQHSPFAISSPAAEEPVPRTHNAWAGGGLRNMIAANTNQVYDVPNCEEPLSIWGVGEVNHQQSAGPPLSQPETATFAANDSNVYPTPGTDYGSSKAPLSPGIEAGMNSVGGIPALGAHAAQKSAEEDEWTPAVSKSTRTSKKKEKRVKAKTGTSDTDGVSMPAAYENGSADEASGNHSASTGIQSIADANTHLLYQRIEPARPSPSPRATQGWSNAAKTGAPVTSSLSLLQIQQEEEVRRRREAELSREREEQMMRENVLNRGLQANAWGQHARGRIGSSVSSVSDPFPPASDSAGGAAAGGGGRGVAGETMFWDFGGPDANYATQTVRVPENHAGNGRHSGWATVHEQQDRLQQRAKPVNEFPTLPPMKAKKANGGVGKQKSTSARAAVASVVIPDTHVETVAAEPPASSSSSSTFQEATMSAEFESWCRKQMMILTGSEDMTLMQFLMSLVSPGEIAEYIREYLGEKPSISSFTAEFIKRKAVDAQRLRAQKNQPKDKDRGDGPPASTDSHEQLEQAASTESAASAVGTGGGGGGGKRRKAKKRVVDPSLLGFSVTSSRIMQGELDLPE